MKYKVEIGLVFFLLLFFVSIDDPMVRIGGILRRIPDLEKPEQYRCVAGLVPENAQVLFFSSSDGSLHWNTYNYQFTRAQYELVPRVIYYHETGPVNLEAYQWFLVQGLEPETIELLSQQHQLRIIQTCGKVTVLARITNGNGL